MDMRKIASPQDLQTELRRLLAYSEGVHPRREVLASELRKLADGVAAGPEPVAGTNEALKWGMFADACDSAGRGLHKLAQEADAERKHASDDVKNDVQKIFESVKKGQLEIDHAVILANTLATKFRKAK